MVRGWVLFLSAQTVFCRKNTIRHSAKRALSKHGFFRGGARSPRKKKHRFFRKSVAWCRVVPGGTASLSYIILIAIGGD
jgi:hypothetical protein